MIKYYTGLLEPHISKKFANHKIIGKNWNIIFEKPKRFKNVYDEYEVIIYANNKIISQRILNLVLASLNIIEGENIIEPFGLLTFNKNDLKNIKNTRFINTSKKYISTSNIFNSCILASKASLKNSLIYSLTKYSLSLTLHYNSLMDLEPYNEYMSLSKFPKVQLNYAYSIIIAYSGIEDLDLEIKLGSEKQSKINGKWNPAVKLNLESRLSKSGIDKNKTILWLIRTTKSNVLKKRKINTVNKTTWAKNRVRDSEVKIIEAIHYSSWLRSCVASHNFKKELKSISPYDVSNVQLLLRKLFLDKVNYKGKY